MVFPNFKSTTDGDVAPTYSISQNEQARKGHFVRQYLLLIAAFQASRLRRLQPVMPVVPSIRFGRVGPADHFFTQKVKLPNADPTVIPTPPGEPATCPQKPAAEREDADNGECYRCVVERLAGHRVQCR